MNAPRGRRTPPQQHWARLLRVPFEGTAGQPGQPEEPAEQPVGVDDLIVKVATEIERHAATAAATRLRSEALRASARAALQAASTAARSTASASRGAAKGPEPSGSTLDVRR